MKLAALSALAIGASLAAPEPQTLTLRAIEGRTLRTTIVVENQRDLVGMTFVVNGEPMEDGEETPTGESSSEMVVVIEDRVLDVESDAATALLRTFVTLEGSMSMESNAYGSEDQELTSDLADEELKLARSSGDEEWALDEDSSAAVKDKAPDHEPRDLGCAELLPDGPVEEGDEWSVPVQWLFDLESPCGDLGMHPDGEELDDEMEDVDEEDPAVSGTITATLSAVRRVDGVDIAVIELAVEARLLAEFEMMGPDGEPFRGTYGRILEGSGTALWNVTAGHLQELSAQLEEETESTQSWEEDQDGELYAIEASDSEVGSLTIEVTVESIE